MQLSSNFEKMPLIFATMEFRTEIICDPSPEKIGLESPVITVGSCFADVMGQRLAANKFNVLANPFGNIYNPISIHALLLMAIKQSVPSEQSFIQRSAIWYNDHFHSAYSASTKGDLQTQLTSIIEQAHNQLTLAKWLIITYGTSWVYERTDRKEIVANCHKLPASYFRKTLLEEGQIISSFSHLYAYLTKLNPSIRIILTVSPVRHIKDTLALNNVSKSLLRIACHKIVQQYSDVAYFPSYELMLDDLRDYRFYKSDMIHPTVDAEDYIWEKFSHTYFDSSTKHFLSNWKEIQAALRHKPFHPHAEEHQRFIKTTIRKLEQLRAKVDVSNEIALLQRQLINPPMV